MGSSLRVLTGGKLNLNKNRGKKLGVVSGEGKSRGGSHEVCEKARSGSWVGQRGKGRAVTCPRQRRKKNYLRTRLKTVWPIERGGLKRGRVIKKYCIWGEKAAERGLARGWKKKLLILGRSESDKKGKGGAHGDDEPFLT